MMGPRLSVACRSLLGRVARHLPLGRGRAARWLQRHPGKYPISFVDTNGHARTADLGDDIECQWFTGVDLGLPPHVLARIGPGDWAIDIGANIGVVTGQLAVRTGHSGSVWAIEPVPRNSERLRELRDRNGLQQIRTFDLAVGAEDGELVLRLPPSGGSGWASATASWLTAGRMTVPVRSLDSLIGEYGVRDRLALVKIDVEGYEAHVLSGALETLDRLKPMLYVEFNDQILRDAGSSSGELLGQFYDAGYTVAAECARLSQRLDLRVVDLLLTPVKSQPAGERGKLS